MLLFVAEYAGQDLLQGDELDIAQWLIDEWSKRLGHYQLYRAYFEGNHNIITVNDKYQQWFAKLIRNLRLNLCESVVEATTDRLEITAWDPTDPDADPDATRNALAAIWEYMQGPAIMNEVHEGAEIEGDSYILVWPDGDGQNRMWAHRGVEMLVWYQPELPDAPSAGMKLWSDYLEGLKVWRLNLYWPDRVTRWWAPWSEDNLVNKKLDFWHQVEDEPEIPNPFAPQVPIAHFSPGRRTNERGRSSLKNAIPIQDALNKAVIDLFVSGEGLALPLRVLTGVQSMPDPNTGELKGPSYDPRSDTWMNIANEQAKLWSAAGVDLTKMVEGAEFHITNMARVTHTPPERLLARAGGVLSGASRKVAEAPLVSKATTRRQWYDPPWRRAMRLVGYPAQPRWGPVTFETDEEKWDLINKKVQAGVPLSQGLAEAGYTSKQIENMLAKGEEEAKKYPHMFPGPGLQPDGKPIQTARKPEDNNANI